MKTNLVLKGRLAFDPKIFSTRRGGIVANFSVVYAQQDHQPVFVPCVSLDTDLSEKILANYAKGDWIKIVNATPTVFDTRLDGYKAGMKFIVWEIDESAEEGEKKRTRSPEARPKSKTTPTKGVEREPDSGGGGDTGYDPDDDIPFNMPRCYREDWL